MNKVKALVPKLRFPEFRDADGWEESGLADITSAIFDGTHQTPTYTAKGIPFYSVENLVSGNANKFISKEDHELATKKNKPEQGDLLITRIGKIGYSQVVSWPHEFSIYVTLAVIKRGPKFNSHFLHYSIQSALYQKEILSKSLLNAVPCKINMDSLRLTRIRLAGPAEQKKIAECLTSLDEVIAAQRQKLDALKTHKKGLMQQLFPREGETLPRLRFPEFQNAGEWTEGLLISLSSEALSNGVFNDPKKVGSGYKLINVSDMYIETTIDESRLSLLELSLSEFEANRVIHGDIFFTRSSLVKSGIAVSNIYLGSSNDVTFDGHLIRFRPDTSKVVALFAHYLFKTAPIRAHLIARGKSATMTTIGQADVASVVLFYPPKAEQQRIADCLTSLDDLIAAQTQKLDALKTHKKGLMQQLFPSPAEVEP